LVCSLTIIRTTKLCDIDFQTTIPKSKEEGGGRKAEAGTAIRIEARFNKRKVALPPQCIYAVVNNYGITGYNPN